MFPTIKNIHKKVSPFLCQNINMFSEPHALLQKLTNDENVFGNISLQIEHRCFKFRILAHTWRFIEEYKDMMCKCNKVCKSDLWKQIMDACFKSIVDDLKAENKKVGKLTCYQLKQTVLDELYKDAILRRPKDDVLAFWRDPKIQEQIGDNIQGYHLLNRKLKGEDCEQILADIVKDFVNVSDQANGNHKSGKDIRINDMWDLSVKSVKTTNNGGKISASSYRLTTVCSLLDPGDPDIIRKEIEERDRSFDHCAIFARTELPDNTLKYIMYMIPGSHVTEMISGEFKPMIGKEGKNKGIQIGWETKDMRIIFSMSSELWLDFKTVDIEQYEVATVCVDVSSPPKYTHADVWRNRSIY
jgi:hypothetical protein